MVIDSDARIRRARNAASALVLLGTAGLVYAAFMIHPIVGWVMCGGGLILLGVATHVMLSEIERDGKKETK